MACGVLLTIYGPGVPTELLLCRTPLSETLSVPTNGLCKDTGAYPSLLSPGRSIRNFLSVGTCPYSFQISRVRPPPTLVSSPLQGTSLYTTGRPFPARPRTISTTTSSPSRSLHDPSLDGTPRCRPQPLPSRVSPYPSNTVSHRDSSRPLTLRKTGYRKVTGESLLLHLRIHNLESV